MNTANPAPTSSYYWPTSGTSDPVLCQNASSTTDPGCAYDYGWHAAADAFVKEAASLSSRSADIWWLDVEAANSWNGDGISNAADLQGATDYLRSQGVPAVGIYSTASQWSSITGGYSASTSSTYASGWAPEFTAQYPMTGSPLWIAGLGSYSTASGNCANSFTGGPVSLAQYSDGSGYDADLSCPPPGTPPPALKVTLRAGTPSGYRGGYRIPMNVLTTSPAGTAVAGARVSWTASPGACPTTASAVATGSGSTSSTGSYAFRLSVRSAGTYCVAATGTATGYSSGSTSTSVPVPAG